MVKGLILGGYIYMGLYCIYDYVVGFSPTGVFNAHSGVTVMNLGGDTNVFKRWDSLNIRRGMCMNVSRI